MEVNRDLQLHKVFIVERLIDREYEPYIVGVYPSLMQAVKSVYSYLSGANALTGSCTMFKGKTTMIELADKFTDSFCILERQIGGKLNV